MMRSTGKKEITSNGTSISFEFHKGSGPNHAAASHHHHLHPHRTPLGKPAPSKWDDAQKWLVGLSRGGGQKNVSKAMRRRSNADDTRLIPSVPLQEEVDEKAENVGKAGSKGTVQYDVEVGWGVDCEGSDWGVNKSVMADDNVCSGVRSVCLRDMGTEMTPSVSQEPSRTATPIRASTPLGPRNPIASRSSTPVRCHQQPTQSAENHQVTGAQDIDLKAAQVSTFGKAEAAVGCSGCTGVVAGYDASEGRVASRVVEENSKKMNPLESRAIAWDEAERAKHMARYKRDVVKIHAWESHKKKIAERKMKKMEAKAERMKPRAQEKYAKRIALSRRIAEEKRAKAEARLNQNTMKTSEKADYFRRTGHLPSFLCFKFSSSCRLH